MNEKNLVCRKKIRSRMRKKEFLCLKCGGVCWTIWCSRCDWPLLACAKRRHWIEWFILVPVSVFIAYLFNLSGLWIGVISFITVILSVLWLFFGAKVYAEKVLFKTLDLEGNEKGGEENVGSTIGQAENPTSRGVPPERGYRFCSSLSRRRTRRIFFYRGS